MAKSVCQKLLASIMMGALSSAERGWNTTRTSTTPRSPHRWQPSRRPLGASVVHLGKLQVAVRAPRDAIGDVAWRVPPKRVVRDDNKHEDDAQQGDTVDQRAPRGASALSPCVHSARRLRTSWDINRD